MTDTLRILLLEDNPVDAELERIELEKLGIPFVLECVSTRDSYLKKLQQFRPHLILTDYTLPSFDGFAALDFAREKSPETPLIFVSGTIGEEVAIEALKKGASDYIIKDRILRLGPAVKRALHEVEEARIKKEAEEESIRHSAIIGGINQIFHEALSCQNDEELARRFLTVAELLTGSGFGAVVEINEKALFKTIAMSDPGWDECRIEKSQGVKVLQDTEIKGIWRRIIADRKPVIANEPASHPDFLGIPEGHPPLVRFLGIPLFQGKKVIGILALANKESEYDHHDVEIVESLCVAFVEALFRKRAEMEVLMHRNHLKEIVDEKTRELEAANRELGKKVREVEDEVEERRFLQEILIKKNEELESFAHRVSHELKNNLVSVKRIMDLVEIKPEFVVEHSNLIADSTGRLVGFVERVLELASSGKDIGEKQEIALDALIPEIFKRLKPHDVDGELVMRESFPALSGDPTSVEQVFSNLISNSLKFRGPEKLLIELDYQVVDGEITIFFRDNGCGIKRESQDRIFDVDYTTLEDQGFGFGLAITLKIVEAHRGRIRVKSRGEGCGVEFAITFPLNDDEKRV